MFRIFALVTICLFCFQACTRTQAQVINNMYDTLCSGDALFGYNATGIYRDTFKIASGDSVRVLNLQVVPRVGVAPLPRWFNTGTNGSGGRLPGGSSDLNWEVSTNINGPYAPAIVMTTPPGSYSPSIWPDCGWISHSSTGSHSVDMNYYYRIDFDLPCFDSCGSSFSADSTFCLTLDLLVDNSVFEIYANGIPQSANLGGVIPVPNPFYHVGYQTANQVSLVFCKGWKRGYNSLIIHIVSGPGYAGFLAQASVNSPPPPPPLRAGFDIDPLTGAGVAPDTGCAPYSVRFSNTSTSATSYLWDFGDGSPFTDSISPYHTYTAPGVYPVRLMAHSSFCGNRSDTLSRNIVVYDYPVVDLGPDTAACGNSILLQSPPAISGAHYLWSSGVTTSSYRASASGRYWLDVNLHGCSGRDSINVVLYPGVSVDLGPDIGICDRDTPLILSSVQPAGAHYLWSNGLSGPQLSVTRTGIYWLEVTQNGCRGSDTVAVRVVPAPEISLGADSIICEQFPLRIGQDHSGALYSWNTGEKVSHISVSTTGIYILSVDLDGCIVSDTIMLTAMPSPDIDLGPDRDICPGETIVLDAGDGGDGGYLWNTGSTTAVYSADSAGLYTVRVTSEYGCIGMDSVLLSYYPAPEIDLGPDTSVCEETPLLLRCRVINTDSVRWSDGSVGTVLQVSYGGEYIATAMNKCGERSDTVLVKQIFCDIMVPNVFTPNGDGINDVLMPLGNIGRVKGFTFRVFNRWGEQIFYTDDRFEGWNGMFKGVAAPMGTYAYVLEYSVDKKPYILSGSVHLLR